MKKIINKKKIILLIYINIFFLVSCTNNKVYEYRENALDYFNSGNYEQALSYFNDAIKVGNGEVGDVQLDIMLYKAQCLFLLKRYNEAKKIYENLLLIDKNNKTYQEIYANASSYLLLIQFKEYLDNDDVDNAEKIYEEIKNGPLEHEKSVMFNQGVLYEKRGEWKNALNAFNYYLKQYPDDKDAEYEVNFINAQMNNAY